MKNLSNSLLLAAGLALAGCGSDGVTDPDPKPPTDPDYVASPAVEARAVWVSRYDWSSRADLEALIDSVAGANFNMIYFQARVRSDAYYASSIEPWAQALAGLGQDPGWDPLAVALSRARFNGLEVHVWLNALIGWCTSSAIPETTPRHVLLQHPDWVMKTQSGSTTNSENCTFLSPGVPGVRTHLARVSADIVRRYNVDGIHLDYIRYPDATMSYDSQTVASYDAAKVSEPALTYDEHRRRQVTATVREVRDSIRAARPGAALSAAVWGIYQNTAGWSGVSTGYGSRFQDSRLWLQQGLIDAIAPMVYWSVKPTYGERLDFAWLANDFASHAFGRHVYVGMGVSTPPPENFCPGCDVVKQIYATRRAQAQGVAVFRARLMHPQGWSALRAGPFPTKVPVPPMTWLPATNLLAP